MFKFNNIDTKMTSAVFIVNFDHISHLFQEFFLLTMKRQMFAGNTLLIFHAKKNLKNWFLTQEQKQRIEG